MALKKPDSAAGAPTASSPPPQETQDPGLEALRVIRHDFKTPLTSLKMLAQIFKIGLEKGTLASQPERTERNCRMLMAQVDKLVELADNLYEISIVQSGRLKLERQLADLRPILTTAIARFEAKIAGVKVPDEPIWGEWDTAKLHQAFCFLLSEAESVEVIVLPSKGSVKVLLKGDFRSVTEKTAPGRYIAKVIIEKHDGILAQRFEVTLPTAQK